MSADRSPSRLVPWLRVAIACDAALRAVAGVLLIAAAGSDRLMMRLDVGSSGAVGGFGLEPLRPIGSLQLLALLLAGGLWLVWQFDATKAVWARGATGLKTKPGMSVAWWLIPIANLFMPLLAMRELHRASGPEGAPGHGWWFFLWWFGYAGGGFLAAAGTLSGVLGPLLEGLERTHTVVVTAGQAPGAWIAAGTGYLLVAASAIPGLAIVGEITRRQSTARVPPRPDLP